MKKLRQEKGIAQIIIILLIVAGIAVGVYLVQQKTNFLPKAAAPKSGNVVIRPSPAQPGLEILMTDLDNTNIDEIDKELMQNDIDAASF